MAYEPTDPSDWTVPPVNAQEALDDLATAISGGGVSYPLLAPGGSVGAPSYSYAGDGNTGFWSSGADTLNWSTAGTLAAQVDSSQQWSFGAPGGNRTHGFYKDVGFGDTSATLTVKIGNSGANEGSGRLVFANQVGAGSQSFDLVFDSRNTADTGLITQAGMIRFQKEAGTNGSNIYFYTSDTSATSNLVLTITPTKVFELAPLGEFRFDDAVGGQYVGFKSPTTVTGTTTYTLPEAPPGSNMFLQSDNLSVLSWSAIPAPTGTNNTLSYFNGSGNLATLPGWAVDSTFFGINCYLTVAPIGGLIKINFFEAEIASASNQPASTTIGFQFDCHVDRTGNNFQNGDITGALYNVGTEGDGNSDNIYGIEVRTYAGVGTNTASANFLNSLNLQASVGAGYTVTSFVGIDNDLINNGTISGDVYLYSSGCSGPVGGNLRLIDIGSGSNVTGDTSGIAISLTGTTDDLNIFAFNNTGNITNNFNGCYVSNSGDSASAYLYVGLNTGDVTNTSKGVDIQVNGNSQFKVLGQFYSNSGTCDFWTGLDVSGTQTVTVGATGLSINLSSITSPAQKTGLSINDGALNVQSNYNTSVLPASPGFASLNVLGGEYRVASGSPVSNTLILANNLAVQGFFLDNMGPDAFLGTLGFCNNGYAAQIVVADTKTVDAYNMVLVAGSIPDVSGVPITDGGTVTDLALIYAVGLLPSGGDINVTNMYGLRLGILLSGSGFSTNTWGIYCEDTGADNWFAKNVIIGGSTGQPSNSDVVFDIQSAKAARLPRLTTAERNALTALGGMIIFNTTLSAFEGYDGATWVTL